MINWHLLPKEDLEKIKSEIEDLSCTDDYGDTDEYPKLKLWSRQIDLTLRLMDNPFQHIPDFIYVVGVNCSKTAEEIKKCMREFVNKFEFSQFGLTNHTGDYYQYSFISHVPIQIEWIRDEIHFLLRYDYTKLTIEEQTND